MPQERTTGPTQPKEPTTGRDIIKEFELWRSSHPLFTLREAADIFERGMKTTPQERKVLADYVKTKEDEARKAKEAKRKEETEKRKKKEEEERKAKEKKKKEEEERKAKEKKKKEEEERKKKEQPPPKGKPGEKPTLIIQRTKYPKWWKDLRVASIAFTGAASSTIIPGRAGYSLFIATVAFTVNDETNIILTFGVFGQSGSMDFGGLEEPKGMVIPMGESPAPCGDGAFIVTSDGDGVTVQGLVVYYLEKEQPPKPTGPSRPPPVGMPLEEKEMPWNIPK